MIQKDLKGIFLLVFFALIAAFSYNYLSPFGIALFGQWEPSKGVVTSYSGTDSVQASIEIKSIEMIKQIVKKKERIILDVRPREIYNQGHLPDALSFPLKDFDDSVSQLIRSIDRQSALLVYCSSVGCTDSHTFAARLKNLRYTDVKVFSGGFRQWQKVGYEIQKNEK